MLPKVGIDAGCGEAGIIAGCGEAGIIAGCGDAGIIAGCPKAGIIAGCDRAAIRLFAAVFWRSGYYKTCKYKCTVVVHFHVRAYNHTNIN